MFLRKKENRFHNFMDMQHAPSYTQKPKRWPVILVAILAVIGIAGFVGYRLLNRLSPADVLQSGLFNQAIVTYTGRENKALVDLFPTLLGFDEPRTYLFLFLNNTELRPAGGFIGVYAVVRVEDGQAEVVVVEGTEVLDAGTPADWHPVPPEPIRRYLGVDQWYFRDSNWSPDFAESARQALRFYAAEGGIASEEIDAVVGVTPTVLERLMDITGPFTIQGITFTPETVIETLEYEVEFGFKDRGIAVADRKQIIEPFFEALIAHMKEHLFVRAERYINTIESLADERHILVYDVNDAVQEAVENRGWSGTLHTAENEDYLLWADANLAALKTDHAIERTLAYTIHRRDDGTYVARATMHYAHTQPYFDWRTTRYLAYARVFVPAGSTLIGTQGVREFVAEGDELGKQWFGGYLSIEPGQNADVTFEYILPASVSRKIDAGVYTLYVQKQAGTLAHSLTLDLDFDTTIKRADPTEKADRRGDDQYHIETDLQMDREVEVLFE